MTATRQSARVAAARSPLRTAFFTWIMRRRMAKAFHAVRLAQPGAPALPADRAVIVYSNHPAWWDPAFFIVLRDCLFAQRIGFGPMDAKALARYAFMRRLGIFGVETDSYRGAAYFLRTARGLLADPAHMLWVTAQGHFSDPRTRPVRLATGVARLLDSDDPITAVPLALEYPFWSESRPEALCRFGAPLTAARGSAGCWQARLEHALTQTLDALAADAAARDPARFYTLVRGAAGVGGVYDLGRRARAMLKGERFSPEHRPEDER